VLDGHVAPCPDQAVALSHPVLPPRHARTDRQGRYRLEGLEPGTWTAAAPLRGGSGTTRTTLVLAEDWALPGGLTVRAGEVARHAVRLMEERPRQISVLPVVAPDSPKLLGLLRIHDIYRPTQA